MNNDDLLKSDITHDSIDHFSAPFCPGLEMKQLPLSPGGPIFEFCGRMVASHPMDAICRMISGFWQEKVLEMKIDERKKHHG